MTFQSNAYEFLRDVEVRLSVELGQTEMKLRDVLALGENSIVVLDRLTDELLDVMVNGKPIAKGEIIAQGDRFGLRIVELSGAAGRAAPDPVIVATAGAPDPSEQPASEAGVVN